MNNNKKHQDGSISDQKGMGSEAVSVLPKNTPNAHDAPQQVAASAGGPLPSLSQQTPDEKKRTPGLKLFDFLLYPVLTNFGVFAISVGATYLTTRGGDRNAAGKLIHGEFGHWFQKRGDRLMNTFKSMGMSHGTADMSKMVAFSFIDGSIMSLFVKMLEDRRERIAIWLDERMGTKPEDLSAYQAEPKQTWLSVFGGRLATLAVVIPTAVALDKTGLNNVLFNEPGKRAGEWLAKKPGVVKFFGKLDVKELDVKELSRIGFFEAFYTTVCTAGLYVSSRFLAKSFCKTKEAKGETKEEAACAAPVEPDTHSTRYQDQVRPKPTYAVAKPSASYREKYLSEPVHTPSLAAV